MIRRALALGGLVLLASCGDALLHPPAPPSGHGTLALTALVVPDEEPSLSMVEAFGVVDRVLVRLQRSGDGAVVLNEIFPVSASGGEVRVRVELELEGGAQDHELFVEMRRGGDALFRAETRVELGPGVSASPSLAPVPVPAGVRVSPAAPSPFVSLGETVQLTGEVLFATGAPIPGLPLSWSTLDGSVVSVSSAGVVTAVGAGETTVRGSHGGFEAEIPFAVTPVAASIEVAPATVALPIGDEAQLEATVRDALGNALGLPVTWSSTAPDIAEVSATGRVTARARGEADVRAQSGSAVGTARVNVTASPPALTSFTVSEVTHGGALLRATVETGGLDTELHFEVGLTPSPASFEEVGDGFVPGSVAGGQVSQPLSGLSSARTYYVRAVAENAEGRAEGEVQSFTTATTAPAPSNLFFGYTDLGEARDPGEPEVDGDGYGPFLVWSFPLEEHPGYEFEVQVRRADQSGWSSEGATYRTEFEFNRAFAGGVAYEIRVRGCRPGVCTAWSATLDYEEGTWQPWLGEWGVRIEDGTTAGLRTRIDDGGLPTEYFFEWGTNPFLLVSDSTPVRSVEPTSYQGTGSPLDVPGYHLVSERLSGLTEGTTYFFRAIARNASGVVQSSIRSFTSGVRPQAPPDLTVTQDMYGNGWHELDWSYPAQNPDYFEIERRVGDGAWQVFDRTWGGARFERDWNPGSHQPHSYRVRACLLSGGCSNPSPERTVIALDRRPEAVTGTPDQVQGRQARLRAESGTGGRPGTLSFEWSVHSDMSFSVETPRIFAASPIGMLNPGEWVLDGLAPGRSYYVRARVENEHGVAFGEVRSFTLPGSP